MARKKTEIKDVTIEKTESYNNPDIVELILLMKTALSNLQKIEDSLAVVKNKMTGGF